LEPGKIQLSGVVAVESNRARAEEILKGVEGVKSTDIDNNISNATSATFQMY